MTVPKFKRWTMLRVEWIDSTGPESGWRNLEASDRDVTGCVTVGMVEHQSKRALTLVLCRDTVTGHIDGAITIPLIAITKLEELHA